MGIKKEEKEKKTASKICSPCDMMCYDTKLSTNKRKWLFCKTSNFLLVKVSFDLNKVVIYN